MLSYLSAQHAGSADHAPSGSCASDGRLLPAVDDRCGAAAARHARRMTHGARRRDGQRNGGSGDDGHDAICDTASCAAAATTDAVAPPNTPAFPRAQGLYDPRNEHDACGVGFIAHMKGVKSHQIVTDGLPCSKT